MMTTDRQSMLPGKKIDHILMHDYFINGNTILRYLSQ